jgi:hypothetical protein
MNQILAQKWFLLQNIKDSSFNRNGVFNNGESYLQGDSEISLEKKMEYP